MDVTQPRIARRDFMVLAGLVAGGAAFGGRLSAAGQPTRVVDMGAVELSQAVHSRAVSCVEIMTAFLDRIEAVNSRVNAIVALQDRGGLIAEARRCDARLAARETVGPLHGFAQQ